MYYFRVWVGSILFALGIAGLIWWIRNLFRGPTMRAMGFSKQPVLYFIIVIILIVGGLWVHSDFRLIPLIGLLAGIFIGWFVSRGKYL
jgi:hypothetical protein